MIEEAPATDKAGKKKMAELTNLLKKINCDISLLNAVPSALQKSVYSLKVENYILLETTSMSPHISVCRFSNTRSNQHRRLIK